MNRRRTQKSYHSPPHSSDLNKTGNQTKPPTQSVPEGSGEPIAQERSIRTGRFTLRVPGRSRRRGGRRSRRGSSGIVGTPSGGELSLGLVLWCRMSSIPTLATSTIILLLSFVHPLFGFARTRRFTPWLLLSVLVGASLFAIYILASSLAMLILIRTVLRDVTRLITDPTNQAGIIS